MLHCCSLGDCAQVSGLPIATCFVWELLDVARSWLQHPVKFMLHCGDHRWHTGNRVSNFNLLFVGLTVYTLLCGVHGWLIEKVPVRNLLCIGWIVSCAFQLCTSCKTSMPYHCPGEQYIYATIFSSDFNLHWIVDIQFSVYVPLQQGSIFNAHTHFQSTWEVSIAQ